MSSSAPGLRPPLPGAPPAEKKGLLAFLRGLGPTLNLLSGLALVLGMVVLSRIFSGIWAGSGMDQTRAAMSGLSLVALDHRAHAAVLGLVLLSWALTRRGAPLALSFGLSLLLGAIAVAFFVGLLVPVFALPLTLAQD